MHRYLFILILAGSALAQLPDFYKSVDRVTWVVGDVSSVASEWSKLPSVKIVSRGDLEIPDAQFRGQAVKVKAKYVSAKFRDVRVTWLQPVGGRNAYTEFLKRYGDGVFSLVHRVPSQDAFNQELERLRGIGIRVLQRESVKDGQYAYLDTAEGGTYALGLAYLPSEKENEPAAGPTSRINQFAFVVRDPKPASAFWAKVGFPAFACNAAKLSDLSYRDKPGDFTIDICWQRQGPVPYEWIVPTKGTDIFEEHLKAHGDGPQHLGFPVDDMDNAVAEWRAQGFPVLQSGRWGEEGKRGSGRFAFLDTAKAGGVTVELLWNFR